VRCITCRSHVKHELPRDPDDGDGIQPSRIGEQLAEVAVVCLLKLVFDKHPCAVGGVLADDVGSERPDILLAGFTLQFDADGLAAEF